MTALPETEYLSIGILSSNLGASVREVERAVDALELRPSQTIDGVAYFNVVLCERIADAISNQKQEQ